MDKIIFLDIDGVLNSGFGNASHQGEIHDGSFIDEDKVMLLGELVQKTGARLVLHSGWRFWFDNSIKPLRIESVRLTELLKKYGMQISDMTPDFTTEEIRKTKKFSLIKAKEILGWLEQHTEINHWIVIDDLDLHNVLISQHQIKTRQTAGLTRQDIEKAEKMLLSADYQSVGLTQS